MRSGQARRWEDTATISNGMAAPTENITADVTAACTGRDGCYLRDSKLVATRERERISCHQLQGNHVLPSVHHAS